MDFKHMSHLLDRYFEGETTRKEEDLIRNFYLKNKALPPDLEQYRPLFLYYHQAKKEEFSTYKPKRKRVAIPAMAFGLVVLIGVALTFQTLNPSASEEELNQAAAEQALEDFKTNFTLLSKNWQKGTTSVHYLTYWDETTKEFIKE